MEKEKEIPEISAYNKLQNIFMEGEDPVLTQRGKLVIDEIVGKDPETEKSLVSKVVDFFKSIDSKLFPKGPKITNIYHKRK